MEILFRFMQIMLWDLLWFHACLGFIGNYLSEQGTWRFCLDSSNCYGPNHGSMRVLASLVII